MSSRNCEACPVAKASAPCESIPKNPHTCVKRVNKTGQPSINVTVFLEDQKTIYKPYPVDEKPPSLFEQIMAGSLRNNEVVAEVQPIFGKNNNNITMSVTNTGEGIPEEQIDKIFDRFYRTDKSRARKSGGYGLGLAIAKSIVEQHGGKISAKSIASEGTTFSVELPRSNRQ